MNDGLFPVVGVAGAVSAALVWGLSAHDPYWRLFDTPRIPAPSYEAARDLQAALDAAPLAFGNADTGAESPAAPAVEAPLVALSDEDPLAGTDRSGVAVRLALRETGLTSIPGPMAVLEGQYEPTPMTAPSGNGLATYERPRYAALLPAEDAVDRDPALAPVPVPLPAPVALRDHGTTELAAVLTGDRLDTFATPEAPAQPHIAADESTETALALDRSQRADVQRRLALAGFDPKGFDGVFGPRTRGAIADFQTAWGFPVTGYLEAGVYADLNQRTEDAYEALRRQAAKAPSAAPALAPKPQESQLAENDERCARRSDGQIIARQGLVCDLAGLTEKFISLGRNSLDQGEDDGARPVAASRPWVTAAGNDQ